MLFLRRFIQHCLFFLLVEIPLQLFGIIVLLPVCFLSNSYRLPAWLRWYDNADIYFNRDTSVYFSVVDKGPWARYTWLAWRNPLNYFSYKYLGLYWDGSEQYVVYNKHQDNIGDSTGDKPGLKYIEVKKANKTYYEYYYIKKFTLFGEPKCLRFRMGHKIGDKNNPPGSVSQDVFVISPVHSYHGR